MRYGARILIVDESPVLRTLTAVALGGVSGFAVTDRSSARDALELACNERFDACVIDQGLSTMSGLELVRELRRRDDYASSPMILLVDEQEASVEREALAAGVDAVVVKPFAPGNLRTTISEAIDAYRGERGSERVRLLGVQSVLDSIPYPSMVLTADHRVVLGNQSFWETTEQGIGDCAVDCRVAMHESGESPHSCPLVQSVRCDGPVERIVFEPALGEFLVCVYPMGQTDERGQQLYLHLTRPAAASE